jgi:hypothetical protein
MDYLNAHPKEIVMRKLNTRLAVLAITGVFIAPAPSFAMHVSAQSLLGTPVHNGIPDYQPQPQSVDRTIVIGADTKHVNVTGGETVKFMVGDRSFEWFFNTYTASRAFDLQEIAPEGILGNQHIKVYLSPDPSYL